MMVAAMTGPAPKTSVTVVPAAWTAAVSLFLVSPAGHLGPGAAQVPVALGPHLQHRRVIIRPDLPAASRAQRGNGHRPGIVGVILVRVTGRQQPHPRTELGLHIQHPLTR
jgi:hypothetical protein